jgi:hypothetical protein
MPWFSHLGSASDTRSRAGMRARPKSPTGFRRSPQATCRSSTSAIVSIHKHNLDLVRPRRLIRWQAIAQWVALLPEKHRQLGCHGSGVTTALSRRRNPHVDLLSQRGFTPSRYTQTPSVAHQCRLRPGKCSQTTTGRIPVPPTTPFETLGGSARRARHVPKNLARLEGPPHAVARESNCLWPHPRCLPPQGLRFRPTAAFPLLPT